MQKQISDTYITVVTQKTEAHFSAGYDRDRTDRLGVGSYFFNLTVTAHASTVYVPISIASGRKSTGFIYQVEGTGEGTGTGSVDGRGDGVTTISFGSITYFKIPPERTVSFKILVQVTAPRKHSYKVVIGRVNYKLNTSDARYKRLITDIGTKAVKFK